jgi:hypothetical protein
MILELKFSYVLVVAYNVPTPGEGADFKIIFSCDPRSFCFQIFVLRQQDSGSCARRVLDEVFNDSIFQVYRKIFFYDSC